MSTMYRYVFVCVYYIRARAHTHTHMYARIPITSGLLALAMGTWSYDESSDDRYTHTHKYILSSVYMYFIKLN
jgi:hypothetical protein